jgi:hypothetical protein
VSADLLWPLLGHPCIYKTGHGSGRGRCIARASVSSEMDQEGIDEERGDLGSPTLAENSSRMGRPDF